MNFKSIYLLILIFSFTNCVSVKKYNSEINELHSPKELKEDVDFAYKKLKRLHPDLYLYTSKDSLDYKMESLKNSFTKPLSSKVFYTLFSPIIASIRQGHTSIRPPIKRQTKKERKKRGVKSSPFSTLTFTNVNDKIFIHKNYGKDSTILVGSELLAINNEKVSNLTKKYQNLLTSDGYNTTLLPTAVKRLVGSLYYRTNKVTDSILINLKYKDSLYNKYIYAYPKKGKKKAKPTEKKKKIKLNKEEKEIAKNKRKIKKTWEKKVGYNKYTKEKTRDFKFITDSTNIGYMKIQSFSGNGYEKFYEEVFSKLDSAKTKNLIIDLRNNPGGALDEIAKIYAYVTDKEFQFTIPAKMTKRFSWIYPYTHSKSPLIKTLTHVFMPLAGIVQLIKVKRIDGKPHFKFNSSKLKKPSEKYNYSGKIYVLINEMSFSASSVLSSSLKGSKRAYLVGNETGGAYNSTVAGLFAIPVLPNSKIKMRFGLMSLETPYKTTPDGFGVQPHKYIKVTSLDSDEQLDWILNDIKMKTKD